MMLGNIVIAISYAAIAVAIIVPVVRAHQAATNRLATATALIFFSCSVGHALHGVSAWLAASATTLMPGMPVGPLRGHWSWTSAAWDLFTAGVGVYYWSLRRSYGVLLGPLYIDPAQRRQLDEVERREQVAIGRAARQQAMYAAVVEHSDDAITSTNLAGEVTVWNPAAERLFGYSAEEALGRRAESFVAPGEVVDRAGLMARLTAGELGVRYEARAQHKDGSILDLAVAMSLITDGSGTVVGTARIIRDLTAANQAEQAYRAAEQRAVQAQRMTSLGQLAGGVAHDFNNLLGIITNFTAFAAEETDDPDMVRADLAKVRIAAERGAGLTRQLLTFTRQDTVHPELIDVNTSIAEVKDLLERTIGAHINLVAEPAAEPLTIYADGGRVQQVLVNLAINARDAMPDGGTLIIEAKAVDLDAAQPTLKPAPACGRYVQLMVSDSGTGMTAEVARNVFEPFYTTKPKGHGTGLGLATVYGIVTEAGGSINVYSELGFGTTFRLYLPMAAADDSGGADIEPVMPAPRGDGQVILVAEDEPALAASVARILDDAGYHAVSAGGGPEALELDAAQGCDLLLTDVVMPEMSGRQLAQALQQRHPGLQVLYMSGYTNGLLDAAHALEQGICVIEKPFTANLLLTEVSAVLSRSASR
jgi:two-component system cell cycle sensor histidine kinase/response regulator CckA